MKRTTVLLAAETLDLLQRMSRESGRSQSELIRDALAELAERLPRRRMTSLGAGRSGRRDISSRTDELLFADRRRGHRS